MILEVIKYPNKSLRKKSKNIECFDSKLHTLLDDMYDTMIAQKGVGLAAIQVGIPLKALIVNIPREDEKQYKQDLLEVINPTFKSLKGQIIWNEGCLSVPGFYEEVQRYDDIELEYFNRFGEIQNLNAKSFLAVALQHENDHLDGVLFVDRLSILKRKKFEKELKKLKKSS